MTISTEAARQALALALATPMTGRLKPRHPRSDFGGKDSHLLKVRRIGRDYPYGDDVRDGDFGLASIWAATTADTSSLFKPSFRPTSSVANGSRPRKS